MNLKAPDIGSAGQIRMLEQASEDPRRQLEDEDEDEVEGAAWNYEGCDYDLPWQIAAGALSGFPLCCIFHWCDYLISGEESDLKDHNPRAQHRCCPKHVNTAFEYSTCDKCGWKQVADGAGCRRCLATQWFSEIKREHTRRKNQAKKSAERKSRSTIVKTDGYPTKMSFEVDMDLPPFEYGCEVRARLFRHALEATSTEDGELRNIRREACTVPHEAEDYIVEDVRVTKHGEIWSIGS